MENQHRKIAGYREFTANEIEMINRAKTLEQQCLDLIKAQSNYLKQQHESAKLAGDDEELDRFHAAEPGRWLAIGKTDIQIAFMAIVRSIAQPGLSKQPDPR